MKKLLVALSFFAMVSTASADEHTYSAEFPCGETVDILANLIHRDPQLLFYGLDDRGFLMEVVSYLRNGKRAWFVLISEDDKKTCVAFSGYSPLIMGNR